MSQLEKLIAAQVASTAFSDGVEWANKHAREPTRAEDDCVSEATMEKKWLVPRKICLRGSEAS
jgi:hypothetical protein